MTANIIAFPSLVNEEAYAEKILKAALNADLEKAIVVGREQNGNFWFSGNFSDAYEIIFLLEMAKKELLDLFDEEE